LRKAFREGIRTKAKMAIINMPRGTLAKVAKFAILIEKKLLTKQNNMAKYHPNNSNNDESNNNDDEDEH